MSDSNEKDAKSWGRDLAIFGAGMVTGAVTTAVVGHFVPSVPVPAPLANAMGSDTAKK